MKRAEVVASVGLAALAAAAGIGAYRLGLGDVHAPGPGFMPFATAAILGLMALGQVVRLALAATHDGGRESSFATSRWSTVLIVLLTLFGFGFTLERIGLSLAVFLLLLVLFGVVARKRWWVALVSSALTAMIVRLVARVLGMQFPQGPLGL